MKLVKLRDMNQIRDRNTKKLLASKKLHLVLDLDQTLVHSIRISELPLDKREHVLKNKDTCMIMGGSRAVKLRPGVGEFLEKASTMFDISVYTMGVAVYANCIVDTLNKQSKSRIIEKVISREDCMTDNRKGLDVVMSHKEVVLIVDDRKDVWMECDRANVISIKPYYFFGRDKDNGCDDDDQDLGRVLRVLREVHRRFFRRKRVKRDVREVLRGVRMGLSETQVTGNGDQQRLYATRIRNGKKVNEKAKKRVREQDKNCVQAMLHRIMSCFICHSL